MADITVTNLSDSGAGSLRAALQTAAAGDTITFARDLAGGVIRLATVLTVDRQLTIDGDVDDDGRPDIVISGDTDGNDVHITGSTTITDVNASGAAGALFDNTNLIFANAPLTLDGLVLTGGTSSSGGGALWSYDLVQMRHSVVAGNYSDSFGGGLYLLGGAIISDSAVFGNVARISGGGAVINGSGLFINVTVSGNSSGGSLASAINASGDLELIHSTVTGNAGSTVGGVSAGGTLTLTNSIVLGNTGLQVSFPELDKFVERGANLLTGSPDAIFATVETDPVTGLRTGLIADNGGDVWTVALRPSISNPAIDGANNVLAPPTDARGFARYDAPGIGGIADIGAYEAQSVGLPVNTVPGLQTVLEDDTLVFMGANAVRVSQPDDRPLVVTLAVQHGAVTLASLANLTVVGGANGSATVSVQGSLADLNAALAGLTYAPAANYNGPDTLTLTTTDGAAVDQDTVAITVMSVNDAPVLLVNIPGFGILEDTPLRVSLPSSAFFDADGDTLLFTAALSDGSALPSWLDFDPATRTFSGTPPQNVNGDIGLKLTASDGQASASATFTLRILPVNDAPVLNGTIQDQTTTEDAPFAYRLPLNLFADPDGDLLQLSVSFADGTALPTWLDFDPISRILVGSPPQDFNGSLDLRVTASDGALSVSDVFTWTFTPANDAPVVSANYAGVGIAEDTPLSFALGAGGFRDPDGDALTYSATLPDGSTLPSWLAFDPTERRFTGTPPANFNGTLAIKVTVSDGQSSAFQIFGLTIVPANDAPVLAGAILDQSSPEDTPWSYQVAANLFDDVDGDTIVFSAHLGNGSALPAWLAFDPMTRTFTGTPPANFEGAIELAVSGSDGQLSATDRFTLTVTPVGDPPVAVRDVIAIVENETREANVLANDVEVDAGQQLTVIAVSGATGTGVVGRELAGLYGSLTLQADGSYSYAAKNTPLPEGRTASETFNYTVGDGHGGTSTADIVVTVTGGKPLPPGDGSVRGTIGLGWVSEATGDFDGNGSTDFLWRNSTTHAVELWTTSAAGDIVRTSLGTVAPNWVFEAAGNLDGKDGDDIVLRDSTTSKTGVWIMREGRPSDWRDLGTLDASWRVMGAGDLDGDGREDLVLLDRLGFVEAWYQAEDGPGPRVALGRLFAGSSVAGIGDLDGDGRDDVLLYNFGTRKIGAWDMSEGRPGGWFDYGTLDAGWEVTGIGNFNGQGPDDIGFYNDTTGEDGAWSMFAGRISDWLPEPIHDDLDPIGAGRFASATDQILWHNPITGAVVTF